MSDSPEPAVDELFYGRCDDCYWKARHGRPDHPYYEPLPPEIYEAIPPATHRYNPGCKCLYQTCNEQVLCLGCAQLHQNKYGGVMEELYG